MDKNTAKPILVAEDDATLRMVYQMIIGGNHALYVRNGRELIDSYRSNSGATKLILSDYVMPIMDGLNALKEIRKLDTDVPYFLLSSMYEKKSDFLKAGATGFKPKPIMISTLVDLVKTYANIDISRTK